MSNQNDLGLNDAACSCGSHAHQAKRTAEPSEMTTTLQVSGMTCAHCVTSVTAELGQVDGAGAVDVQLVPNGISLVTVSSAAPLDVDAVAAAIDEAGYALVRASS